MHAVEIEHATKTFGATVAVDDVSLLVPEGAIYGFIGPNGSGKTTTLRMIMRIYLPDRGRIRVLGDESVRAAHDDVTYLPEERGLYRHMRVRDLLRFYARLKNCSPTRAQIDEWLERVGLSGCGDTRVQALSKGMSQKVQFIAAVISRPRLVLLDEPFSGLDPVNAVVLRDLILDLRRQGTTVIFSTHDMAVAERMCDAIFMIFRGRKVLDGTLEQIQRQYGSDTIHVRAEVDADTLARLPGVAGMTDFGRYRELRMAGDADPQAILAALSGLARVHLFEVARPSLHDIFVRIAAPEMTGEMKGEAALA